MGFGGREGSRMEGRGDNGRGAVQVPRCNSAPTFLHKNTTVFGFFYSDFFMSSFW
jgi:hypothetical protein